MCKIKKTTSALRSIKLSSFIILILLLVQNFASAQGSGTNNPQVLPGFSDELMSTGWSDAREISFDSLGRMYVVEGIGKVWIIDTNGVKIIDPLLDISEEVGQWNNHGLTGFALDKDFLSNGYFYVMYTVDRHYLLNYGTPNYDPDSTLINSATINRVTRYQANPLSNFTTVLPGSRFILIGEDKKTGIPVTFTYHDGACLAMSTDGSLLISTGDNAHGGQVDTGSHPLTYYAQCLADSILTPALNVGAFRAQTLQSLNGKLLRIDPMTGLGLPSNPYYDSTNANAVQSKVWCLGLRQPFRFSVRPGTSSSNVSAGKPGSIYICDVGFYKYESLDISKTGAENFGWPKYEGMLPHQAFSISKKQNMFAPNPLYGTGSCTQQYFQYNQLLLNATLNPNPSWVNACDTSQQIPSSLNRFIQTRPALAFYHHDPIIYVPSFNGYDPVTTQVGDSGSSVSGIEMATRCIAGTAWYQGNHFPSVYQNQLFLSDYDSGFVFNLKVDSADNILSIDTFANGLGDIISLIYNATDQSFYYIDYPNEIHRIRYTLGINTVPKAIALQDVMYGPGPLTVNFNGQSSYDPENAALTYFWDFGDGNTSTLIAPQHTYNPLTSDPTKYDIQLTVTDTGGLTGTAKLIVSANNTPPNVQITSPVDGSWYSVFAAQFFNLTANVSDSEHTSNQLHYKWYTSLHHTNHEHPNPIDTDHATYLITDPEDSVDSYYYEITLTVTDDGGLSSKQSVYIYQGNSPIAEFTSDKSTICLHDSIRFFANIIGKADSIAWIFQNGTPATSSAYSPTITYNGATGLHDVTLIAYNPFGSDTAFYSNMVKIKKGPSPIQNLTGNMYLCADDSILLSTDYDPLYSYQWLNNGTSIAGADTSTYLATTNGLYNVLVTYITTGCNATTLPINYAENVISPVINITGNNSPCTTDSILLLADSSIYYTYQWFNNGSQIIGAYSNSFIANATGNYNAVISDTIGCVVTSAIVTVTKMPDAAIIYTTDSIICPVGDVVIMNANTGQGLNYQWFKDSVAIAGAINADFSATDEGLYYVVVSDTAGCAHISNTLAVLSCVGISSIDDHSVFQLYPNPVSNVLNISFKDVTGQEVNIKISDALGNEVLSQGFKTKAGANNLIIKTASLLPGAYQLTIESNKTSTVKRFIKN